MSSPQNDAVGEKLVKKIHHRIDDIDRLRVWGQRTIVVCKMTVRELSSFYREFMAIVVYRDITDVRMDARKDRARSPAHIGSKSAPGIPLFKFWDQHLGKHVINARHMKS